MRTYYVALKWEKYTDMSVSLKLGAVEMVSTLHVYTQLFGMYHSGVVFLKGSKSFQ